MNDLNNAAMWLQDKIRNTNPNRKTSNRGAVLLYNHVDLIPEVLHATWQSVVARCRSRGNNGVARLITEVARCGRNASYMIEKENDLFTYDHVHIGALIFSALHGFGFIKIMRDPDWAGHKLRAPYIVELTQHVEGISPSRNTVRTPIADVSSVVQGNKRPLIKRWGKQDDSAFSELLNEPFVKAANVLQQTGWQINAPILEYMLENYDDHVTPTLIVPEEEGPERKAALRHNSRSMANRITLDKAQELLGWDEFYQYVDMDYRGRIYYCEPFLNYQGSDAARALLLFKEGKPLGDRGKYWLAVHTACSFNPSFHKDEIPEWCEYDYKSYLEAQGLDNISADKMTLNDRYQWTMQNLEAIVEAGEHSVVCDEAEKPLVALACCIEWYKMLLDMDDYVCHLPIPIDGSNNGWQHLGAMSRDEKTGDLVALTEQDVPKDFYVTCAQKLMELMPEWFEERNMPMKDIRKGIAKRGSMTRAYSAGKGAIAENMYDDVWQANYHEKYNITEEDCKNLAANLVDAIDEVCPGPLETMGYLQKLAQFELDTTKDTKIEWTTPSGFPVKQEYLLTKEDEVRFTITPVFGKLHPKEVEVGGGVKGDSGIYGYNGQIKGKLKIYFNAPDRQKVASAISPNFVHSHDAAHMALTIAEFDRPFGAVHDSFSCHACDVDELVMLTKSTFLNMYEVEDFFENMKENILTDSQGFNEDKPSRGNLDLKDVLNSNYFFA